MGFVQETDEWRPFFYEFTFLVCLISFQEGDLAGPGGRERGRGPGRGDAGGGRTGQRPRLPLRPGRLSADRQPRTARRPPREPRRPQGTRRCPVCLPLGQRQPQPHEGSMGGPRGSTGVHGPTKVGNTRADFWSFFPQGKEPVAPLGVHGPTRFERPTGLEKSGRMAYAIFEKKTAGVPLGVHGPTWIEEHTRTDWEEVFESLNVFLSIYGAHGPPGVHGLTRWEGQKWTKDPCDFFKNRLVDIRGSMVPARRKTLFQLILSKFGLFKCYCHGLCTAWLNSEFTRFLDFKF